MPQRSRLAVLAHLGIGVSSGSQKNSHHVGMIVPYGQVEGGAAAAVLAQVRGAPDDSTAATC